MKTDKEKIFNDALKIANKENCYFIEQLISYLPITKPTFYDYFKVNSYEFNEIKGILNNNRIRTKQQMYKKWFESDNPTLQIALFKLLGTDEECHRLNGTKIETTHKGAINIIDLGKGEK